MNDHHFYHGDFGWNADLDTGFVSWDEEGDDEPTEEEAEAAQAYWDFDGYNQYKSDKADEIGDYRYEQMRESQWEY